MKARAFQGGRQTIKRMMYLRYVPSLLLIAGGLTEGPLTAIT